MRVAVLRGGPSTEYDASLKTGEHVLSILRAQSDKFDPQDIFISRDGVWHVRGVATTPDKVLKHTDVVFNALHGAYGEDGQVQQLLAAHRIPHTGSEALSSALAMQHHLMRSRLIDNGFKMPRHTILDDALTQQDILEIFRTYMHPMLVMPVKEGTTYGKRVVGSYQALVEAIAEAFKHSSRVLVEEAVRGKEVSCGVIENMRGQKLYALLPHPHLSTTQNRIVEDMSRRAHTLLGLRHYSASHFIVTPRGNMYMTSTSVLPELHHDSPFIEALKSVGIPPQDCVIHLLNLALGR